VRARAWCLHAQPFEVETLKRTLGEQVTNDDFALLARYLQCADLDAELAGTLYLQHFHPYLLVGVRPTLCPTACRLCPSSLVAPGPRRLRDRRLAQAEEDYGGMPGLVPDFTSADGEPGDGCVLQSRKRRTVLCVLSCFTLRYLHMTSFVQQEYGQSGRARFLG
jgi:hypothetical protein